MKTVYFVRHGETEGNTGKIFQGVDTPLTEKGLSQARLVADRCSRIKVEAMISGVPHRQQQTATIISKKINLPFTVSELFDERRRPTSIVGRTREDRDAIAIEEAWNRSIFDEGPRIEDGENFDDFKARAGQALEFLVSYPAQNILVVTSGNILIMLAARVVYLESLTQKEFGNFTYALRMNNTGLTLFEYKPNDPSRPYHPWRLATWNDHAHLA